MKVGDLIKFNDEYKRYYDRHKSGVVYTVTKVEQDRFGNNVVQIMSEKNGIEYFIDNFCPSLFDRIDLT